LVRTPEHQLLYDTGPQYTENFDAGSGIIVPYLQSQGLRHLDALIVSHNDHDHSGGLKGVLAATKVDKLWLGEPDKYPGHPGDPPVQNCHLQAPWRWEGVDFRFISWPISKADSPNNHSCLLLVDYGGHRILLTGDAEAKVERQLLAQQSLSAVQVLLAPHHGSHTSSTTGFVAEVQPRIVIYSAGFHNSHGHPHKDVRQRYEQVGSRALNTAYDGALEFSWGPGSFKVTAYREAQRRYWFSPASD